MWALCHVPGPLPGPQAGAWAELNPYVVSKGLPQSEPEALCSLGTL